MSLEPENAIKLAEFMNSNAYDSRSSALNGLLRMMFSATPMDGLASADRARAYNDVRNWTMRQVHSSLRNIAELLEASVGD